MLASPALARWSDPVRNLHPEEPSAPPEVQHPIYYTLPIATPVDPTGGVTPEALLQEFMDRHSAANYPAAFEAALRLIQAVPDRPAGHYNLACAAARMGRTDEAFDALREAVAHGWRDAIHMRIDPDLGSLRRDARFAEIVADVRSRIESERAAPRPLRADGWELVAADLAREAPEMLRRYHVPGASVALIHDGRVVWSSAFGVRDARHDEPLRPGDRFRLRAPLHLLTVIACGRLEREHKLQLAALLQEAANQQLARGPMQPAQSDDRAAGEGDRAAGRAAASVRSASNRPGEADVRRLNGGASDRSRTVRSYARNSMYGALRTAVEAATGSGFPAYCEREILAPLGLTRTSFASPDDPEQVTPGHSYLGTPLRPSVLASEFSPGGAAYTTADDLARLIALTMPLPIAAGEAADGIFLGEGEAPNAVAISPADAVAAGRAVELVTQLDASLGGQLGLALQRAPSRDDRECLANADDAKLNRTAAAEPSPLLQLDESASGIVCLARWNPQRRNGIVILCNAATGRAVADRLALLALGGGE